MDEKTLRHYELSASDLAAAYDSVDGGIALHFQSSFPKHASVLEIGSGSGRDLNTLHELGYDVHGIEPAEAFRNHIIRRYPHLGSKVSAGSLPELEDIVEDSAENIVCSAVLMHIPDEEVFDSVYAIRRILKPRGRLLISIPLKSGLAVGIDRDESGRLFNGITPDQWQLIFERIGFTLLSRTDTEDALARPDRAWSTLLFELGSGSMRRPLDLIESVLNRDSKVATYKPALLRALAELALTGYNQARWCENGKVQIPTGVLAEKWILYFWPIVESLGIPQTTGKSIAFRSLLTQLIDFYKPIGGLSRFCLDYRSNQIPQEARGVCGKLISKVKHTIWNQPVRYAGGGEEFSIFQYDTKSKCIAMDASLWRELSLTGSWIQDATILRWAELTSRISKGSVKPSQVIDLLLTNPLPERDTNAAKLVYDKAQERQCVWSGKRIEAKYDVDHAIPYSLWHNNDLWNLLPADSKVNGSKSDKLPTRTLLCSRKDAVIHCWESTSVAYPIRFEYEMRLLCGAANVPARSWQSTLFTCFTEAVEVTASQRCTERWEP